MNLRENFLRLGVNAISEFSALFKQKNILMEKNILCFDFPHSLRTSTLLIQVILLLEFDLKNILLISIQLRTVIRTL